MASLAPPAPSEAGGTGRDTFLAVGCAACHAERLGPVEGAFTDLLLHDLGHGLSDRAFGYGGGAVAADGAQANEWRTPPLWGLSASAPYLHDGRAPTLDDAIRAHDGEAAPAVAAYVALDETVRGDLVRFLRSL